jgi:carbohydrate kinase (thermoresistant glucokinase family)
MVVLLMGVSGAGKTTLGERLARELGCRFIDADDYHPPENVRKMAAGVPLEDADRWPWLERLNGLLRAERGAVLACSALKEKYRRRLAEGVADFRTVHLRGGFDLIHGRLQARQHRYMPSSLLQSQFDALEPPGADALVVEVSGTPEETLGEILARLAAA